MRVDQADGKLQANLDVQTTNGGEKIGLNDARDG